MNSIYLCAIAIVLANFGLISPLLAGSRGGDSVSAQPSGPSSVGSQTNRNATATGPDQLGNSSTPQSSLQKMSERMGHNKEIVKEVDPRTLKTDKTDKKFQGSLLDLGLNSIQDVKAPPESARSLAEKLSETKTGAATTGAGDDRFKEHKTTAVSPEPQSSAKPSPQASASPVPKPSAGR